MKSQVLTSGAIANRVESKRAKSLSELLSLVVFENSLIRFFASLFSAMLGESVTTRQTFHLVHAQIAFAMFIMLCGAPIMLRAALLAWFVLTLVTCRRSFS